MQDMVDLLPTKEIGGWTCNERNLIRGKVGMSGPKARGFGPLITKTDRVADPVSS